MAKAKKKSKKTRAKHPRRAVAAPAANYSRADKALQVVRAMHEWTTMGRASAGATSPMADWMASHALLKSFFEETLTSLSSESNVDTSANPAERAQQMRALLDLVASDLDASETAASRDNIKRFLLHVSWHEGAKLTKREQMNNGPARSFFQFEMARAKDAGDYAVQKGWVGKLTAVCGYTEKEIQDGIAGLSSGSSFPEKNLVHTLLKTHDLFGCYMARIAFKRVNTAIPTTNAKHAEYWYKYWKVTGGDPETLKKIFTKSADEVDALL
jgi:hypothetical protein